MTDMDKFLRLSDRASGLQNDHAEAHRKWYREVTRLLSLNFGHEATARLQDLTSDIDANLAKQEAIRMERRDCF